MGNTIGPSQFTLAKAATGIRSSGNSSNPTSAVSTTTDSTDFSTQNAVYRQPLTHNVDFDAISKMSLDNTGLHSSTLNGLRHLA